MDLESTVLASGASASLVVILVAIGFVSGRAIALSCEDGAEFTTTVVGLNAANGGPVIAPSDQTALPKIWRIASSARNRHLDQALRT